MCGTGEGEKKKAQTARGEITDRLNNSHQSELLRARFRSIYRKRRSSGAAGR